MVNLSKISPEQLLALLQDAISSAPEFVYGQTLTETEIRWLGKCDALLDACNFLPALLSFRLARSNLNSYSHERSALLIPLFDALSRVELLAPISMQGAFIPPGDTWNGYAALVKIIQTESDDVLLVDPYLTADFFTYFAPHCVANKGIRCLTAKRPENHPALLASYTKWSVDSVSQSKPVRMHYAKASELHDRLIAVDNKSVWLVSQSIKDIAKRSPASVVLAERELGELKVAHYDDLWKNCPEVS
jgi:hypothetical protein